MMASTTNEKPKRLISGYFTRLKHTSILIDGKDISKMGIRPGPIYKEIFNRLLEARLNEEIKSREDEIRFVKQHFDSEQEVQAPP